MSVPADCPIEDSGDGVGEGKQAEPDREAPVGNPPPDEARAERMGEP